MKLTIRKFQELYEITQMETDELTKSSLLVQCFTGKTEEEINKMSIKKFNKICSEINKSFDILKNKMDETNPKNIVRVNGKWYFLNFNLKKQTAARYIEVATFGNDIIGNLHKIMATMANPMKLTWKGLVKKEYDGEEHEEIANDMLDVDFTFAYHSAVFFYLLFTKSMLNLKDYLKSEFQMNQEQEEAIRDFIEFSDGLLMPKWCRSLKVSV